MPTKFIERTLFYVIIMSLLLRRSTVNAFANLVSSKQVVRGPLPSSAVHRTLSATSLVSSKQVNIRGPLQSVVHRALTATSSENNGELYQPKFRRGDLIQVEVINFGPLGASVDVIAHRSHNPADCISPDEPALGRGMILQQEINYFRRGRGGVDIVKFETLPAYVESVREQVFEDDGEVEMRLDIALRPPGGKAKAKDLGEQILQKLKESEDGVLNVGDKSTPEEINAIFPGASKSAFKKGVAALYKRGLVTPGPNSVSLM